RWRVDRPRWARYPASFRPPFTTFPLSCTPGGTPCRIASASPSSAPVTGARLVSVCDADPQRLAKTAAQYPGVRAVADVADVARDPEVQGVVVAASAVSHYPLAKALLEAGKDVYVEKPLTLEVTHAEELVRLARIKGRVLMVGHLLLYHPGV